jgi:hypothetical protein
LFVDVGAGDEKAICSHLVEMLPSPGGAYAKGDVQAFTTENRQLFVVRILGRRRVEIWCKGKKVLVWDDAIASWSKEETWDSASLSDTILACLGLGTMADNDRLTRLAGTIGQAAMRISQTRGQGASFVIQHSGLGPNNQHPNPGSEFRQMKNSRAVPMTLPFPKRGEGLLDQGAEALQDVAIQDGGTQIDIESGWFCGRMQWLPVCPKGHPFSYRHAVLPRQAYEAIRLAPEVNAPQPLELVGWHEGEDAKGDRLEALWKARHVKLDGITRLNYLYWPEWYHVLHWGTRHMNSLGMSVSLWEKAVVITMSSDGYITVFHRGREIRPGQGPTVPPGPDEESAS